MITAPLSAPGAKVIVAWPSPNTIESMVGASGAPAITDTLPEAAPAPLSFNALSVMEYSVPLLKPGIVIGLVASLGSKAI